MSPGGVVALSAWGTVVYIVGKLTARDYAAWRRSQKRGHVRRVPPRPSQTRMDLLADYYAAMAHQAVEIKGLPETEPVRTVRP